MLKEGEKQEKYIPDEIAQMLVFSYHHSEFLKYSLAEKLTFLLKKLI